MKDKTYSLPLLPISMAALTVEGANAIEENLRYLISLFSLFDAQIKTDAIGTLGYLELSESADEAAPADSDAEEVIGELKVELLQV